MYNHKEIVSKFVSYISAPQGTQSAHLCSSTHISLLIEHPTRRPPRLRTVQEDLAERSCRPSSTLAFAHAANGLIEVAAPHRLACSVALRAWWGEHWRRQHARAVLPVCTLGVLVGLDGLSTVSINMIGKADILTGADAGSSMATLGFAASALTCASCTSRPHF